MTYEERKLRLEASSIEEITPITPLVHSAELQQALEKAEAEEVGAHVQFAYVPQYEYLRSGFSVAISR